MADLNEIQSAGTTKIVGSDTNGLETTPVGTTINKELMIRDTHDNGGLDTVLNLVAGVPVEGKVGVTVKASRKYVIFEALSRRIKWGFSNSTQSFDIFKSQLLMVPIGENTQIWFDIVSGTGDVAFGEIS